MGFTDQKTYESREIGPEMVPAAASAAAADQTSSAAAASEA